MIYSEAAYYDGAHVQHIADYYERLRLKRIREQMNAAYNRGAFRRALSTV